MYRFFYNNEGKLDAINQEDGASLPYNPQTKTFDESHPLTQKLREWETTNGTIDLKDLPIESPVLATPNWEIFRFYIITNSAYNRIRLSTLGTPADLAGTRLESMAAIATEDWELVASQWQILLSYALPQDRPSAEEIEQWQRIASGASMPFTFTALGAIVLPNGKTFDPFDVDPASLQMNNNIDAYFQDSDKETQYIQEETDFKIDGLHPDSFSEFSWKIWETETSTIKPVKVGGKYTARITFVADCSVPTVISAKLIASDFAIPSEPVQPFALGETAKAITVSFFIRESFLESGLKLRVSASASTKFRKRALYLVRLAG